MPPAKQKNTAPLSEEQKAAQLAKEQAAADEPKRDTVDITAPRNYRRAGMKFGPKPVSVDPYELGEKTMKLLMDDPVLIIRPTPAPQE